MNTLNRILSLSLLALPIVAVSNARSQTDTLRLNEAVRMAVAESPAIAQGEAALDAARARTSEIAAITKPQLSIDATYTRIDPTVKVALGDQTFQMAPNDNYNGAITLQQSIWDFGHASSELAVLQSSEKQAADNIATYKALAAYQTVQVYYALLSTDESLRIEEEQQKVLNENLGITQEREHAGTATTLDPLTTQVRISSIQSQIAELQSARLKQESMLRRLTGLPAGTTINVSRSAVSMNVGTGLDSLEAAAKLARAEIQVAKDAETTAKLQIDAANRSDNPTIGANVTAGIKDGYLPDLYKPTPNWAGTIGLKIPLLDGGRTARQVDEAEANYRAAQAHTRDVELQVTSEVEQAVADLQASQSRLALTSIQIRQAKQAYDIAELRYKNGAATNLDLITAQSALEQAELLQSQLTYNYELNQYNLNRAVGVTMW